MMRLAAQISITALAVMWAGVVSAAPEAVNFSLISSANSGGAFPSVSTYDPPLPVTGSGTIDEVAGSGQPGGFDGPLFSPRSARRDCTTDPPALPLAGRCGFASNPTPQDADKKLCSFRGSLDIS